MNKENSGGTVTGTRLFVLHEGKMGSKHQIFKTICHPSPPPFSSSPLHLPQEMVIDGLKPDTTYSITVAAYTTKGDGARSKPKLVVTKSAGQ